ncbi:hypothetical protein CS542_01315 [Pedobacter sp. IW39]|nr:hypothetical protein CS542_01315 [Pedobacter sp. IW39]
MSFYRLISRRLLLYACTHMVIMPFVMVWIWSAFNPDLHHPALYLLAGISLLCGFSFELPVNPCSAARRNRRLLFQISGLVTSIVCVLLVLLIGVIVQCRILYTYPIKFMDVHHHLPVIPGDRLPFY